MDCKSNDIVYSNLFTGVHGNYLRPSIAASGLDPDNLPESDPSTMNFLARVATWTGRPGRRESGLGIGTIRQIMPVGEYVGRVEREYFSRKVRLAA